MQKSKVNKTTKSKKLSAVCISRRINKVILESIELGKPVIIPTARHFSDVFSSVKPRSANETPTDLKVFHSDEMKTPDHEIRQTSMTVRDTLICDHHLFRIVPKRGLLDKLDLMFIEWDSLYWELIQRSNGTTLITLKYNKIIGSRWIAIIRTDSLPKCLRK